jgi:uncharacterized protein with HEPN domain
MTTKEPKIFLEHILNSIEEIYNHIGEMGKDEFFEDVKTQDSVIRRMQIIGEAVKNIPDKFRINYPDIPWKDMAGLRDVLVHEYFDVDLEEIWALLSNDLKDLKVKINQALNNI